MKNVFPKLSFALSILALGTFVSSCTGGPLGIPATPSNDVGSKLYRPNNGAWYGHWTPDRAHAEDHLRAYNANTGSNGGVIEGY